MIDIIHCEPKTHTHTVTLAEVHFKNLFFLPPLHTKHKHSKLNFVSPSERHAMQDKAILSKRKEVLEEARSRNPKRWSNGIRNCDVIGEVVLNPEKESETETRNAA